MKELPLAEMESLAAGLAREAGEILARHFRSLGALNVEFKDKRERDPVTNADTECQRLLVKAITERFPEHGILGEEDEDREGETAPAPDTVWVLDPLDGTRNFLNGLPVYASSIGVMHRGVPVVGAVYIPWPGGDGMVVRAHRGGGAFTGDEPIGVFAESEPHAARLVTLPAYFNAAYSFRKPMRDRVGELRSLGSLAYDMVMVAMGVTQYSITTGPHLWDVVGGLAVAAEAGAHVALGHRERLTAGAGTGDAVGADRVTGAVLAVGDDDDAGVAAVGDACGGGQSGDSGEGDVESAGASGDGAEAAAVVARAAQASGRVGPGLSYLEGGYAELGGEVGGGDVEARLGG